MTKEEQQLKALWYDLDKAEQSNLIDAHHTQHTQPNSCWHTFRINTAIDMTRDKYMLLSGYLKIAYPDINVNLVQTDTCMTIVIRI